MLACSIFSSYLCHNSKEGRQNAGYQNDGFMTTADAFFPFVNQKF